MDILCLQDTHLKTSETNLLKDLWEGEVFLHGISTNSLGVAILFKDTMQYDILDVIRDDDGNMLTLQMNCAIKNILLINAYGPNIDNPTFSQMVKRQINTIDHDYFILCVDLSVTLNLQIFTFVPLLIMWDKLIQNQETVYLMSWTHLP